MDHPAQFPTEISRWLSVATSVNPPRDTPRQLPSTLKPVDRLNDVDEKRSATFRSLSRGFWLRDGGWGITPHLELLDFREAKYRNQDNAVGGSNPPWRTPKLLGRSWIQPTPLRVVFTTMVMWDVTCGSPLARAHITYR